MEHLALEIFDLDGLGGSKFAAMDDDASISITDTSEIFGSGDVWSYEFRLNVLANAHIFGTSGDMHGSRLHDQLHKRRARLWVEGEAMFLGYLTLDDEAEVDADGNVDVGFESGQKTFEQLIEGGKANQVPMINDVVIGMALWRKRKARCKITLQATAKFGENDYATSYQPVFEHNQPHTGTIGTEISFVADGELENNAVQAYPRMVFPKGTFKVSNSIRSEAASSGDNMGGQRSGGDTTEDETITIDCINTDYPYDDAHPYCNTALCYQRYGYTKKNDKGDEYQDYSGEPEAERGYETMPANRINSAPNFYVIYWIKALMNHLGIYIEENQMMDVEDLRRLFFVNTNCAYIEPNYLSSVATNPRWGKYQFTYEGRNVKRLMPEYFGEKKTEDFHGTPIYSYVRSKLIDKEKSKFESVSFTKGDPQYDPTALTPAEIPTIESVLLKVNTISDWPDNTREQYERDNSYLHKAIASSECFPNVDISEVIDAIESGFGMRLLFDDNYQRVRIVLLRNIFRSHDIQDVKCEITSNPVKVENSTRGFRMTYGDSEDTHFYYKGFADLLPHKKELWIDDSDKHDYSHWKLDAQYQDLIKKVSAFDKTCYVDPYTGEAFGIKIDKDAKRYEELHPSLFEYAGYMDAEDGDCTGEDETIETINVGFTPAIMNDTNFEEEKEGRSSKQKFALFVDEAMRPRRPDLEDLEAPKTYNDPDVNYSVDKLYEKFGPSSDNKMTADDGIVKPGDFAIMSDMFASNEGLEVDLIHTIYKYEYVEHGESYSLERVGHNVKWPITNLKIDGYINEGVRLYLQDNYEPNDDGVCPIETHDWGLTLGIMRGSGDDMKLQYSADPDDGEGNDTWDKIAGSSVTAHPDTCDNYGNEWDYNGEESGIGPDGRIALKLRAEKLNPYFNPKLPESANNPRYLEITNERLRQRGLIDTFYKEYSFWTRNARIAQMQVRMTLAQLLAIDKTKRVKVGDITGFIRKMQYSVSNKTGLGLVTMEIMYI